MRERSLRLLESSDHYLDRYPWEGNFPPPLDRTAVARVQLRINRICGLSSGGNPNVRIIWPADPREEVSMTVIDGEKRARYAVYSHEYQCERQADGVTAVEIVTVDIVPQRWMVEEFDEPSRSYTHLFTIGHHDERCCEGSESVEGHLCYGLYREPEQQDLDRLQQLHRMREEYRHFVKSGEPISWGEMQDWLARLRNWKETAERVTKERYKNAIISGLMPTRPRLFSGDPTVHKWGKFHFLQGHNKSGTPKNN